MRFDGRTAGLADHLRHGGNGTIDLSFLLTVGLPLLILACLALLLPVLLVPRKTRRHWEVAVGIWASAGFLLLGGAVIFAVTYAGNGVGVWSALMSAPLATGWFFLKLSGYGAIVWVPVLLLSWLWLAQRVEKRKGEDRMREGRE